MEISIKGTVRVISSDSPYTDGNARFTTIPLKPLSEIYAYDSFNSQNKEICMHE